MQTPASQLPKSPSPAYRLALPASLLLAGVVLAVGIRTPAADPLAWLPPVLAAAMLIVPSGRALAWRTYERVNGLTAPQRRRVGLAIWAAASLYLAWSAWEQGRIFHPLWHDERSYTVLARLIASGRLWSPTPPCSESFESIYILVKPVYASMYFVGAGLIYAPMLLLHLPPWIMAVAVAGLMVALLFRVVSELLNPAFGVAAAVALLGCVAFRQQSIRVMAHQPTMVMLLACLLAWLLWNRGQKLRWMALLGFVGGWAMVTRPLDAVLGLAPIGVLVLARLWSCSWPMRARVILISVAAASPFAVLQLVSNLGVTGSWRTSAWEVYNASEYPNSLLGFHPPDPSLRAASSLPQKQWLYENFYKPLILRHQPQDAASEFWTNRRGELARSALPSAWLIALVPLGLLGLRDRTRVAWAAFLPLYVIAYTFYYWLPPHYAMVVGPTAIFLMLLGMQHLAGIWETQRARIEPLLLVLLIGLCIGRLPEFTRLPDEPAANTLLESAVIEDRLGQVQAPALVLFRWSPEMSSFVEPVYQYDSTRPDDAPVVRAHDLGPEKNAALIRHYAKVDPGRVVWRYDRVKVVEENEEGLLVRLGTAGELARRLPE